MFMKKMFNADGGLISCAETIYLTNLRDTIWLTHCLLVMLEQRLEHTVLFHDAFIQASYTHASKAVCVCVPIGFTAIRFGLETFIYKKQTLINKKLYGQIVEVEACAKRILQRLLYTHLR